MGNGAVIYRGPSLLTGDPIRVVITGLTIPSKNPKTGAMAQTWILRDDKNPIDAVNNGDDDAICGDCRHRSGSNIGRSCYVVWWIGPNQVYKATHPAVSPSAVNARLRTRGLHVRLGAYGDPAAVPSSVWLALVTGVAGWTGYTHHWKTCEPILSSILMASVDSVGEQRDAEVAGWRTFRVRPFGTSLVSGEVRCPASAEANHQTTCRSCELCQGSGVTRPNVAIFPHGQRVKWFRNGDVSEA